MAEPFSVTEALIAWVGSLGYEAHNRVPKGAPPEFVTVERAGGGESSLVDHPSMAVQCWAATEERAEAMANTLRLAMRTSRPPAGIHSVRVDAGPYPLPDEATRRPRYQFVLDVACQLII